MLLALLALLIDVSITGWMLGLDRFFGNELLEEAHEEMATAILPIAGIHVLAAAVESFRHRANLIGSMVSGVKRTPTGEDVDNAPDTH